MDGVYVLDDNPTHDEWGEIPNWEPLTPAELEEAKVAAKVKTADEAEAYIIRQATETGDIKMLHSLIDARRGYTVHVKLDDGLKAHIMAEQRKQKNPGGAGAQVAALCGEEGYARSVMRNNPLGTPGYAAAHFYLGDEEGALHCLAERVKAGTLDAAREHAEVCGLMGDHTHALQTAHELFKNGEYSSAALIAARNGGRELLEDSLKKGIFDKDIASNLYLALLAMDDESVFDELLNGRHHRVNHRVNAALGHDVRDDVSSYLSRLREPRDTDAHLVSDVAVALKDPQWGYNTLFSKFKMYTTVRHLPKLGMVYETLKQISYMGNISKENLLLDCLLSLGLQQRQKMPEEFATNDGVIALD